MSCTGGSGFCIGGIGLFCGVFCTGGNKLQEVVSKNSLKLNYYETEADSKLKDISFEPNGDYEQILRLIVLSDTKNYNDKTLRLGVITLDLESALYSRLNRKEQPNKLCYI